MSAFWIFAMVIIARVLARPAEQRSSSAETFVLEDTAPEPGQVVEVTDKGFSVEDGLSINQHQFDALLSFTYNVGTGNLARSTLLRKVKANPQEPSIRTEFSRWVYGGGKRLPGLVRRRKMEADLYFS